MSGDSEKTALQVFADEFNLPKILAGQAGTAISRLIGGALDIPSAKLEQWAQGIKDKTAAKSIVASAIADKTAEIAIQDEELLERAKASFVSDLLRKQGNKETIATKTIEYLGDTEIPAGTPPVDDDWLNVFSSLAENMSSERMQEIWANLLAGEIRKPGEYSISTLRFVSELDKNTAEVFEIVATRVFGDYIPQNASKDDEFFPHLLIAVETGLASSGPMLGLTKQIDIKADTDIAIAGKSHCLILCADEIGANFSIPIIMLTKIGRELLKIVDAETDLEYLKKFSTEFQKPNVKKIEYSTIEARFSDKVSHGIRKTIWERSENVQTS